MTIPTQVDYIISTLENAGYEAYIVGGCMRDILLNQIPQDWDIATSATPSQTKALFERTIDTGIKHGTITVFLDKQPYEVTTYRMDGEYLDGRRPSNVKFVSDIYKDLSRRDFTMNAIAYNPHTGFVDPFNGQADIRKKVIRCVGDPNQRFAEDALRMMRAIRFAGTTAFDITPDVIAAIKKLKNNLENVSPERKREELGKLITSQNPAAVALLCETGLAEYVFCDANFQGCVIIDQSVLQLLCKCPPHEPMRLALLFYLLLLDMQPHPETICKEMLLALRYDNKTMKETLQYVERLGSKIPECKIEIKKILRHMPQDIFKNLIMLMDLLENSCARSSAKAQETHSFAYSTCMQLLDQIHSNGECYTLRALAVNGQDLACVGIKEGKQMGDILENLLDIVVHNPEKNTRDVLMEFILEKV